MSDPREGLERLRAAAADGSLAELCARHHVRVLTVFGSTIGDKPNPQDLDIAVGFEYDAASDFLALMDDLMALTGVDRVDLLDLDRAGPVAKEQGLTYGTPLFESEPGAYAVAEMAASGMRRDTAHLRRRMLELMAE
ncbi:MAG: hypothetical protein GEV11_14740 [Streptosporangiales bacterium]|nr:hypothetical protein [Streptosporangiales bacterium]